MESRGWQTTLITPARELTGRVTHVVVGLIMTDPGGLQVALRIGEEGDTVILPTQSASELIAHLRQVATSKATAERKRPK